MNVGDIAESPEAARGLMRAQIQKAKDEALAEVARLDIIDVKRSGDSRPMSIEKRIAACLSDDLRKAPYKGDKNPLRGHCYVASEAYYHLSGGKRAGLKPMFVTHEGAPHWFIVDSKGRVTDITAKQFATKVPYHLAKGKGFLTGKPSARAAEVIRRVKAAGGVK